MDRKVYVSLLILLGVALALAGPAAGDMKASFASAGAYSIDGVVRQLMSASKLEDGIAPELTVDLEVHRRILATNNIKPPVFNRNGAACIHSCPAPGGSYTNPGRGCNSHYQCVPH